MEVRFTTVLGKVIKHHGLIVDISTWLIIHKYKPRYFIN